MAQAMKDSMPEDMSRPGTASTMSDAAEDKRVEGDFAFGVEHAFAQPGVGSYEHVQHTARHSNQIKPSRHIGNFQPLQETPSVLLPSAAIASPNAQTAHAGLRPTGVPMIYQPVHSNTLASPLAYEYPRQVRPQAHPEQMSYTAVGPLSPPYTPLSSVKQQTMSMPTSVDLSVTPDLVTPMTGFGFDNSMMTYNRSYPSRQEAGKYPTIAVHTHSQGLLPGTNYVYGNGYHGMTSASTPVSPVHPGPLRRTVSHVPQGTHLATPSTYVPQMVNGGLVGLGIMMPNGDGELYNGLMPLDKTGPAIYSGM